MKNIRLVVLVWMVLFSHSFAQSIVDANEIKQPGCADNQQKSFKTEAIAFISALTNNETIVEGNGVVSPVYCEGTLVVRLTFNDEAVVVEVFGFQSRIDSTQRFSEVVGGGGKYKYSEFTYTVWRPKETERKGIESMLKTKYGKNNAPPNKEVIVRFLF